MITLSLTKQEAQVLAAMINIAVQARGLEAAEAGVLFARKIAEGIKQLEESDVPPSN